MKDEQEYIFHRNMGDDESAKVRHHDNQTFWIVECYDKRISQLIEQAGATEQPSYCQGRIFQVDAKQLIEFIAETNGLVVEFRTRRRQQLSAEQIEARRQRMAEVRAKQFTNV